MYVSGMEEVSDVQTGDWVRLHRDRQTFDCVRQRLGVRPFSTEADACAVQNALRDKAGIETKVVRI